MFFLSLLYILLSNSINLEREASLIYSQICIYLLIATMYLLYGQLSMLSLKKGIGVYGGLYLITYISSSFSFFIFLITSLILSLTAFYSFYYYDKWIRSFDSALLDFILDKYHISRKDLNFQGFIKSGVQIRDHFCNKYYYFYKFFLGKERNIYQNIFVKYDLNYIESDNISLARVTQTEKDQNKIEISKSNNVFSSMDPFKDSFDKSNYNYEKKSLITENETNKIIEYPLLILFVITGSIFLISSADLISIFLSIELQSYGLYLISTSYRNSETATAGGLTYFLLGGFSSTFIILAISFLYANSGSTLLENMYILSDISDWTKYSNPKNFFWYNPYYLHLSLLIFSTGFLFKVSAAPFHFWSPDVYDAIPTVVTTFVAILAKISIFILFTEIVYFTSKLISPLNFNWTISFLISSMLSLVIGSVLGLTQFRLKRLYAYSTISHIGFILLSLSICSIESIQSYFFYIMQYSISNLNAFFLLLIIGYSLLFYKNNKFNSNTLQDKINSPVQLVLQLKGYFFLNPLLALSLTITLFSFIGIPPLLGFFAKQMVLSAALDKGYFFMALIAILTSVISAVYYLAVVEQIFFYKSDFAVDTRLKISYAFHTVFEKYIDSYEEVKSKFEETCSSNSIMLPNILSILVSILTTVILLFMFTPVEWINMCLILSLTLFI